MRPLHAKASYWVRKGIFDRLTTFAELQRRINELAEEKDRGDVFEIFIEGYLATQPITQCTRHWVVGHIPLTLREQYNLPSDPTGIDGIYETKDGSYVAYQVKYRQRGQLTFAEVAPFLGITEKFAQRVIFTNAARLSDKVLKRTNWVSGEIFHNLSPTSCAQIEAWIKIKRPPVSKAAPDPRYQPQALKAIRTTLKNNDRATAVMACGTGKTLVALWAAEQQKPRTVLILVPSLTLMQQTLREWSEQTGWGDRFSYICVCSDQTVGRGLDEFVTNRTDAGFRIDTDPRIVRAFLTRTTNDVKIIFSTYQSSPVVGKGAKGLPAIDLAIFDEAHKTTGFIGGAFGYALSDKNIRIRKRLFLTATPRHIDIRYRDRHGDFRVLSMDDERVYGPRAYTLSFAAAAKMGIICPYKVIISLIDKTMVDDFTRRHGITLVRKDEIAARWMANLIATQRAIIAANAKKIITFHSRVSQAQEFSTSESYGVGRYLPDYQVRHVNGAQNSAERSEIIHDFASGEKTLLTNARCLTEGVNIPAVDMVAFIDPRQSRIDITQAVGRAMRKPRAKTSKTVGYVMVPLFASKGRKNTLEEAVKSENFEAVADVLNALQEHDEDLVDIIREIRQRKGEGKPFNPKRLKEKVEVLGPRVGLARLEQSIGIEIAEKIGTSWDEWYGLLTRFKRREGHCNVPGQHKEAGYPLGKWVSHQRSFAFNLAPSRRSRLDEVGFIWNALDKKWHEGYAALVTFKLREGHCNVPKWHSEAGFPLGTWLLHKRVKRTKLSPERYKQLDRLGIIWEPHGYYWDEGIKALRRFKKREGHCLVPVNHVEGNVQLGHWVNRKRTRRATLSKEQIKQLDKLGFVWSELDAKWERGLTLLQKFKERNGHCEVPLNHETNKFPLGRWVSRQRLSKNVLSNERRARLDTLSFIWKPHDVKWNEGFRALLKFSTREHHCRVPLNFIDERGFRLGRWVNKQRQKRTSMPTARKKRLDALGFIWKAR